MERGPGAGQQPSGRSMPLRSRWCVHTEPRPSAPPRLCRQRGPGTEGGSEKAREGLRRRPAGTPSGGPRFQCRGRSPHRRRSLLVAGQRGREGLAAGGAPSASAGEMGTQQGPRRRPRHASLSPAASSGLSEAGPWSPQAPPGRCFPAARPSQQLSAGGGKGRSWFFFLAGRGCSF